jgi:serine protease Do
MMFNALHSGTADFARHEHEGMDMHILLLAEPEISDIFGVCHSAEPHGSDQQRIWREIMTRKIIWILLAFLSIPLTAVGGHCAQNLPRRDRIRLENVSNSLQELAKHVSPAVVQVVTKGFFVVQGNDSGVATQNGTGSGVILDPNGYIVTNAHVVEGAQSVEVLLDLGSNGSSPGEASDLNAINAEILGIDSETDLAVLKIDKSGLPFLKLADSSHLQQGELVLACGSPFGLQNTISMGIISSVARQLQPENPMLYIQTDAPINPGNSGGPLINTQGEVLGINTMIFSESGGNQGLGFAIPSNIVSNVYRQIKAEGHVHHGYLGIDSRTINATIAAGLHLQTRRGAIVQDVDPDGPAAASGVRPGDIVLGFGGNAVSDAFRLLADVAQRPVGEKVRMDLLRGRERQALTVTIGERPDNALRFADMVTRQSNLIRQFGILALDMNEKLSDLLPALRMPGGVVVAAKVIGLPSPSEEFEPGDLIGAVNGEAVASITALRAVLDKFKSGDAIVVNIQRGSRLALLAFELP